MAVTLIGGSSFTTIVDVQNMSLTVPAGVVAGDYLLCAFNLRGSAGTTMGTPLGFTSLINQARSTNGRHYVFGKIATGAETTVPGSTITTNNHTAILLAFRGVSSVNPVNISGPASAGGGFSDHTAPSVTTTVDNCYIVNFAVTARVGEAYYSWAPGTPLIEAVSVVGTTENIISSAYLLQPVAGATAPDVATVNAGTNAFASSTIALAPAASLTGISVLQGISTLQF